MQNYDVFLIFFKESMNQWIDLIGICYPAIGYFITVFVYILSIVKKKKKKNGTIKNSFYLYHFIA